MTESGRMLIVDDEVSVREILRDYFEDGGYTVTAVADGHEALAAFARERPEVVLLDVRMPGLDGLTVLRRLREADPEVAVIMVTANEDLAVARETLSVGAFDYVAKPFDFEHLSQTVMTAFVHSARMPLEGAAPAAAASEPWTGLVTDVFRAVREMSPDARGSTGLRLEEAALAAARSAIAGHLTESATHLAEVKLLVTVAGTLAHLSPSARAAIEGALETAGAALPPR
jgi:CheY-like chemotaxis protein